MSSSNPNATYGPWSSGLFDCFSDPYSCCLTCWCPCISFGQIADIVDKGNTSCILNGGLYLAIAWLTGCACCYSCCYRTKMRQQYKLEDGPCNDFLVHFCCELCALCQEYRELESRGLNVSLGWEGNIKRQNREVAMAPAVEDGMKR